MPPDTLPARAIDPADLAICRRLLGQGSRSFAAASRLLPRRVRGPAAIFYAFCRVADDAVDESPDPAGAVEQLTRRLDRIYQGRPEDDAVDRALASVVRQYAVPRSPFDALLEGFLWDAQGRAYETLDDVLAYAARVASAVGVVMTAFMGSTERPTLARACDLGAAMQLTNIARDVGEDARRGRLYLPAVWMREEGLEPEGWLARPRFEPGLGRVVRRLLEQAEVLYRRADSGIAALPVDCRPAIRAASWIYADIGRVIAAQRYDSYERRARTGAWRKLGLLARARFARAEAPDRLFEPPLPQTAFLLEGVP